MAQINIPYEIIDKNTDRGEVDTLSMLVDVKKWIPNERAREYVLKQIKKKSVLEKKYIEKIVDGDIQKIEDTYYNSRIKYADKKHTKYAFSFRCLTSYLTITLAHSTVLGQNEESILSNIKKEMFKHFKINEKYLNNLNNSKRLGRIDYKRDYRYKDEEVYEMIMHIIKIAPEAIVRNNYYKNYKANNERAYIVVYKSKSNRTAEFIIYDKQKERMQKYVNKQISNCSGDEYIDEHFQTIRFEVRILNQKLNALKKQGISKEIASYKNKEMAERLFNFYAEQVFFTEPFYRLDIAKKIIRNSSTVNNNMKIKLCKLLAMINIQGYTYARNKYSQTVKNKKGKKTKNYNKFNNYIKKIRNLGINPLTFKSDFVDYEILDNFTLAENCLKEEALMPFNLENFKKKGNDYYEKL